MAQAEQAACSGSANNTAREDEVLARLAILVEGQRRIERRLDQLVVASGSSPRGHREDARARDAGAIYPLGHDRMGRRSPPQSESIGQAMMSQSQTHQAKSLEENMAMVTSLTSRSTLRMSEGVSAWALPSAWPATVRRRQLLQDEDKWEWDGDELQGMVVAARSWAWAEQFWLRDFHSSDQEDPELRCMLDPHSGVRIIFDLVSLLALLYDLISLPVIMAWEVPIKGALKACALATIIFWTADFALNFLTGYYEHGRLILKPARVARHYLRTWLVPDLLVLGCNFVSLILAEAADNVTPESLRFLRVAKVARGLRVVGFVRLIRIIEVLERFADRSPSGNFLRIGEAPGLVLLIILTNHVIACIWYAIGRYAPSDTGMCWLDGPIGFNNEGLTYRLAESSYQYFTAIHWSLTQMTPGSMQVNAVNTTERQFTVFCLVSGMLFFSSIVSALSAKTMQYRMKRQDMAQKLRALQLIMRSKDVRTTVAVAVQKHAKQRMATRPSLTLGDVPALRLLSENMQRMLHYEFCRKHLTHPLFRWWEAMDTSQVQFLCQKALDFAVLRTSDMLFHATTEAEAAYIVTSGQVKYTQEERTARVDSRDVQFAESGTWICEAALWTHWVHVGNAEATGDTEILIINVHKMKQVLQGARMVSYVFQQYGAAFHSRILSSTPPTACWPTDLEVPLSSFEDILPSLPLTVRELIGIAALRQMRFARIRHNELVHLNQEVSEGKCVLMLTSSGESQRLVTVAALMLKRDDGRILVQLGTVAGEALQVAVKLPGSKQRQGEVPLEVIKRILTGTLAPMAHAVQMADCRTETIGSSRRSMFTLRSTYVRVVHEAYFDSSVEDHVYGEFFAMTWVKTHTTGSNRSPGSGIEVDEAFVMAKPAHHFDPEDHEFVVYAWLRPEEFDHFQTDKGERELLAIFSNLRFDQEMLQAAVARLQEGQRRLTQNSDFPPWESPTCTI